MTDAPLLEVTDLAVTFGQGAREVAAVKSASFTLHKGETLSLVGESGSGKTVTALSILRLLPYPRARHPKGSIKFKGAEIVGASEDVMRTIRGNRIGMVFQEPMTSLNPLHNIEKQVGEVLEGALKISPESWDKLTQMRVAGILKAMGWHRVLARRGGKPCRVWMREGTQGGDELL